MVAGAAAAAAAGVDVRLGLGPSPERGDAAPAERARDGAGDPRHVVGLNHRAQVQRALDAKLVPTHFSCDVTGPFQADRAGVAVVDAAVQVLRRRRSAQNQAAFPARRSPNHPSVVRTRSERSCLSTSRDDSFLTVVDIPCEGEHGGERRREVGGGRELGDGQERLGRQDVLQPVAAPRSGHVHREPPD